MNFGYRKKDMIIYISFNFFVNFSKLKRIICRYLCIFKNNYLYK